MEGCLGGVSRRIALYIRLGGHDSNEIYLDGTAIKGIWLMLWYCPVILA